ncbi:DUF5336 domain-containing protein [Amycolatopsis sp. PS_44_ISF1]|uniref:DUF5336 domain-containing protein n=1 Tax=Amycolatopsis sp. PS_44_ISF1 TaxID=2974917 RepID=UPI0028DE88E8|nr:DUF5336 domain-containing protein [Amycolatopsis sp. PS_44_ISF1]MDT8909627.1 DUF5336 domain-containing protein [Amycolatopsis sp. PS_44_ISF1]
MTYPSGGPGYPQQGGGQQPLQGPPPSGPFPQQGPPPSSSAGGPALPQNLPVLLALVVAVLGLVQYFLGFADDADGVGQDTVFLLVGGLLAALHVLPKAPKVLPFAALFSVLGALGALDAVVGAQATPGIVVVVLILGIAQMLVSVGGLLLEYDVIKPPAPKPAAPQYHQPQYGQSGPAGPFGQPQPQYQQPGATPPASGQPGANPGQPPVSTPPPGPGQQATTYAPQQGQFFQQPPAEQPNPGTPPGGFGQQG